MLPGTHISDFGFGILLEEGWVVFFGFDPGSVEWLTGDAHALVDEGEDLVGACFAVWRWGVDDGEVVGAGVAVEFGFGVGQGEGGGLEIGFELVQPVVAFTNSRAVWNASVCSTSLIAAIPALNRPFSPLN